MQCIVGNNHANCQTKPLNADKKHSCYLASTLFVDKDPPCYLTSTLIADIKYPC